MLDALPTQETPSFDALSKRQQKFVMAYVETGVASKAYAMAGYKGTNSALEANASRLIRNDKVLQAIEELKNLTLERFAWTKETALLKLASEADDKENNSGGERIRAIMGIADLQGWKPKESGATINVINVTVDNRSVTAAL